MKHLYLVLFILVFLSAKTQNWQAVYSDRLVYFDNSQQAIKIVSVSVDSTGDSTFKNYPQLFMDSLGRTERFYGKVVDSVSWIGRRIIIKPNGYNGFVNDSNEILWLNTQAYLGDTFTFIENNKGHIRAYCSDVFYSDTFGVKDSVKRFKFLFSVKPSYGGRFDTLALKNVEILLSKNNGLLVTPVYRSIIFEKYYAWIDNRTFNYCPKNYFTNRRFNDLDIGDEYEFKITNDENNNHYHEDRYYYQVIKKEQVGGTDSIKYTFLVKLHAYENYKAFVFKDPSQYYWQPVIKHYVYNETKTLLVNDEPINGWLPGQFASKLGGSRKNFVYGDTCNLIVFDDFYGEIIDTVRNIFYPPFESAGGRDYHSKIGEMHWYLDGSTGNPNGVGRRYDITYRNFCNTISGAPFAKIYVYGVGIDEVVKDDIIIYPNPANNAVFISAENIVAIKVLDLSGKEAAVNFTTINSDWSADVSNLASGVYFISVETEAGKSNHKLLVQH